MRPTRLVWQIYPAFIVMMIAVIGAMTWYGARVFHAFYLEKAASDLEARTYLIQARVADSLFDKNTDELRRFCKDAGRASATRITIIAENGSVIADSNEEAETMENHGHRPEILSALQTGKGSSIRFSATLRENMLYLALPVVAHKAHAGSEPGAGARYLIRLAVPITALDTTLHSLYWRIVWGCLAIALVAALLSMYVSRIISRPIEEMTKTAEQFAKGDFKERMRLQLKGTSCLEIAELTHAMENMAELLDEKIKAIVTHRNQLETVFSSMVESVIALDLQERVISINTAAARLLGVSRKSAQGRFIQEILRNIPLQEQIQQSLHTENLIADEIVLQDDQGERYLQTSVVSLRDGKNERVGVLIVMNDVTSLRRLERVRRDFVANVSHELRTPITSIRGYVEALLDGAIENKEDSIRFLQIVERQSDRLIAIIDDLLELSRIEQRADDGSISLVATPLAPVLQSAVQTCQLRADQQGVVLEHECPSELVLPINTTLIEQAVVNLLINALQHSKKGDVVRLTVEVTGDQEKMVRIDVRDSGCGIAREHLPRLFERFYRSNKARSREAGGTGLGLAIVKHIVQAHQGHVEVQSREGEGALFSLFLPTQSEHPA